MISLHGWLAVSLVEAAVGCQIPILEVYDVVPKAPRLRAGRHEKEIHREQIPESVQSEVL